MRITDSYLVDAKFKHFLQANLYTKGSTSLFDFKSEDFKRISLDSVLVKLEVPAYL